MTGSRRVGRGKRVPIAAAAVVALAVGGCGDSEDEGLSRAELTEQATAICERHFENITAAASEVLAGGKLPNPRQFGELAQGTIVPELTAQTRELRALDPPEDLADEYTAFLDASEAAVADIEENPAVVTDPTNFEDVNRRADELGLPAQCRVGPSG